MNTMPLQHRHGGPTVSVRRVRSLWPPVGPIERQEMNMRGPGIRPEFDGGLGAPVGAAARRARW